MIMAKRRETFTATCVRRVHSEPELAWTHYRVTGKGIPEMSVDGARYHKDIIVSASTRWVKHGEKPEVMLVAANKNGEPKRNADGNLIQLWGGGRGDLSASATLKKAGATKVTTCAQVPRGPLDRRRRRR
jgi:hypothetical protein